MSEHQDEPGLAENSTNEQAAKYSLTIVQKISGLGLRILAMRPSPKVLITSQVRSFSFVEIG